MKIPKVIFYIFGIDPNFCNKPFSYFHYLNIKSAAIVNPTYKIQIYYKYKPQNEWFDKLSDFCEMVQIDNITNDNINFSYSEHIGDYLRLILLYNNGGIYLDVDTICIQSFDDLLSHNFVMAAEYGIRMGETQPSLIGLCNATMLSEPKNNFIKLWIDDYKINYRRNEWNYNSVQMSYILSQRHTELIYILPQAAFFKYSWDIEGKKQLFELNSDISDCYSIHLWEHLNYNILCKYDNQYIINNNDTISNLYKKII